MTGFKSSTITALVGRLVTVGTATGLAADSSITGCGTPSFSGVNNAVTATCTLSVDASAGAAGTINAFTTSSALLAAAPGQQLYHSLDGGAAWTALVTATATASTAWTAVDIGGQYSGASYYPVNNALAYAAAASAAGVFTSANSGVAWTINSNAPVAWASLDLSWDGVGLVAAASPGQAYFTSSIGLLLANATSPAAAWADVAWAGTTGGPSPNFLAGAWVYRSASNTLDYVAVATSANGLDVVAVTAADEVLLSRNNGSTWTRAPLTVGTGLRCTSVSVTPDFGIIVVTTRADNAGTPAQVYVSSTAGASWVAVAVTADGSTFVETFTDVAACNSTRMFAASSDCGATCSFVAATSSDGFVYTSTDGGLTWAPFTVNRLRWQSIACSASGARVVAGTQNGDVYTTTVGAVSFLPAARAGSSWYVDITADGSRIVAAPGSTGPLNLATWNVTTGAITWSTVTSTPPGPSRTWTAASISSDGSRIIGAYGTTTAVGTLSGGAFGWVTTTPDPSPTVTFNSLALSADGGFSYATSAFASTGQIYYAAGPQFPVYSP